MIYPPETAFKIVEDLISYSKYYGVSFRYVPASEIGLWIKYLEFDPEGSLYRRYCASRLVLFDTRKLFDPSERKYVIITDYELEPISYTGTYDNPEFEDVMPHEFEVYSNLPVDISDCECYITKREDDILRRGDAFNVASKRILATRSLSLPTSYLSKLIALDYVLQYYSDVRGCFYAYVVDYVNNVLDIRGYQKCLNDKKYTSEALFFDDYYSFVSIYTEGTPISDIYSYADIDLAKNEAKKYIKDMLNELESMGFRVVAMFWGERGMVTYSHEVHELANVLNIDLEKAFILHRSLKRAYPDLGELVDIVLRHFPEAKYRIEEVVRLLKKNYLR